jgi:hypothetical protein
MDMEVILGGQGELPSIPLTAVRLRCGVKQLRKQADWSGLSRIDVLIRGGESVKNSCRFILREDLCAIPRMLAQPQAELEQQTS